MRKYCKETKNAIAFLKFPFKDNFKNPTEPILQNWEEEFKKSRERKQEKKLN